MASSHKTEHYGLSQFAPLDRPAWLVDYNTDMAKIDTALHNLDETGGGGGTLDQTARDMTQAAQDAAKDAQGMATAAQATADEALEKAEEALNQQGTISGDITNINEEITQIKTNVGTAQSTAETANQSAEEALTLAKGCVKRSGDTMTGALKLVGDPVDDADAANKGYVDSLAGNPFPDVPFTDDRWKFACEFGATLTPATFTHMPREFLFVASGLTFGSGTGFAQVTFYARSDATSDVPICSIGFNSDFAVVKPVVAVETLVSDIHRLIFASTSTSVEYGYIKSDLTLQMRIASITGGTIKMYWR